MAGSRSRELHLTGERLDRVGLAGSEVVGGNLTEVSGYYWHSSFDRVVAGVKIWQGIIVQGVRW